MARFFGLTIGLLCFVVAAVIVVPLAYWLVYSGLPSILGEWTDAVYWFAIGALLASAAWSSWLHYKLHGPSEDTQRSIRAVNAMKRFEHDSQVLRGDVEGPNRPGKDPGDGVDRRLPRPGLNPTVGVRRK